MGCSAACMWTYQVIQHQWCLQGRSHNIQAPSFSAPPTHTWGGDYDPITVNMSFYAKPSITNLPHTCDCMGRDLAFVRTTKDTRDVAVSGVVSWLIKKFFIPGSSLLSPSDWDASLGCCFAHCPEPLQTLINRAVDVFPKITSWFRMTEKV